MKKITFTILALLCAAVLAAGCASATCKTIEEACGGGDDSIETCKDDYKDGDSDCKSAMRDFADCVDDKGCDESCTDEAVKVANKC